jgi:hypothetical protein
MNNKKKCTGCKGEFPLSNFYKNRLIHDGHSNYCVSCTKVNSKKYFQRKKEKVVKLESDGLIKMVFLNNHNNGETNSTNTDSLMKILMVEKMCNSILNELQGLKMDLVKSETEFHG